MADVGIDFLLTPLEMAHAKWVGTARQRLAEKHGLSNRYALAGASPEESLLANQRGCYPELLVARYTGLYWHALLDHTDMRNMPDVGKDIEVRSSIIMGRRLIVHKPDKDPPARRYVFVEGEAPRLRIVGWMFGHEAQDPDHWETKVPSPAYFLDRELFYPPHLLL